MDERRRRQLETSNNGGRPRRGRRRLSLNCAGSRETLAPQPHSILRPGKGRAQSFFFFRETFGRELRMGERSWSDNEARQEKQSRELCGGKMRRRGRKRKGERCEGGGEGGEADEVRNRERKEKGGGREKKMVHEDQSRCALIANDPLSRLATLPRTRLALT